MLRQFGSTIGLSLLCLAGCGDPNSGVLFADIQYATRCEMTHGCDAPHDRDICGFNHSDPCVEDAPEPTLSCSVVETDTTRTISFSARQGSGFSLSVSNLQVPFAGGSASGGDCRVTVVEGANTYTGLCGGSNPSEAQPCQIEGVTFTDDMGNPTFEGHIFCQFLKNQANPTLAIEVTAPGSGPTPAGTPARFRMANCRGLTISG